MDCNENFIIIFGKVKVGICFFLRCVNYMNYNISFKIFYIMLEEFYISILINDKDKIYL